MEIAFLLEPDLKSGRGGLRDVHALHRTTAARLDVRTAHVSKLGADVEDAFYVVGPDGRKVADPEPVRRALLAALTRPAP